jgi:hypothetical protein
VIVAAALLGKKHDLTEYLYKNGSAGARLRAMVGERPIQHALRPVRGVADWRVDS